MSHRIKLQWPNPTQDASGLPVKAWTEYRECWGNIDETAGREMQRGGVQVEAIVDATIDIHHPREGRIPVATDRAVFVERGEAGLTRTFHIERVERLDGRTRMLRLHCKEDVV